MQQIEIQMLAAETSETRRASTRDAIARRIEEDRARVTTDEDNLKNAQAELDQFNAAK